MESEGGCRGQGGGLQILTWYLGHIWTGNSNLLGRGMREGFEVCVCSMDDVGKAHYLLQ